ncbi:hypothetical protein [Myxococcus phage Mx1]|nr:hypothetical protein [Myxococcus phage Mx1]
MAKKKLMADTGTQVKVVTLYVDTDTSPGGYNVARLGFHYVEPDSYSKVAGFKFQRHDLRVGTESFRELPNPEFDFGPIPFSYFYGASTDDSFKTDHYGVTGMRRAIRIISQIEAVIEKKKLKGPCDLARWKEALQSFDVEFRLYRRYGSRKFEFLYELDDHLQNPGRRYLERANGT